MKKFSKLNESSLITHPRLSGDIDMIGSSVLRKKEESEDDMVKFVDGDGVQISEPCKFVSKIFESKQMADVYHLQAKGESSYAKHMALDIYYKDIQEILDKFIEVYSGQYDIIENYEVIKTDNRQEEPIQYFFEVVEFINSTKKLAFIETDTHLFNIIDEMVALLYKTIYKLRYLK